MSKDSYAIKTISKPFGAVDKLWKKGYNPQEQYRPLSFLIFQECEDGLLVQNTVSGELILVDKDEWDNPSPEVREVLVNKRFLVPQNMDDKKYIDQLRVLLSMALRKKAITYYTILPTSCCNARCFYCFESDYKQATMSEETAQKVVDYIERNSNSEKVRLSWFGGEPMLGSKTIDYICSELRARGVEYISTMVSNGYLFTEELAEKAKKDWKLRKIQITLDGTEEVYNSTKNYKYKDLDESPYQRVLRNIELLAKNEIKVSIRLNMSLYNVDDIKKLVNELAERFKNNRFVHIYSHLIYEDVGNQPISLGEEKNKDLFLINNKINDELSELGFCSKYTKLPVLMHGSCMADYDSAIVISPKGELGKCEHYYTEKLVGNIEYGITDVSMKKYWKEKVTWDLCYSCQLYPYCYRLKHCDPERECVSYVKEDKIFGVQETMKYKYKEFLRKNTPQEFVEEETDFID